MDQHALAVAPVAAVEIAEEVASVAAVCDVAEELLYESKQFGCHAVMLGELGLIVSLQLGVTGADLGVALLLL